MTNRLSKPFTMLKRMATGHRTQKRTLRRSTGSSTEGLIGPLVPVSCRSLFVRSCATYLKSSMS
eukprot:2525024-Pyramimonas_sp.AAC.1